MKQVFFTLVILAVPVILLGTLLYMFGHGLYTVFRDWIEKKQLEDLRQETRRRAQQRHEQAGTANDCGPAAATAKPSPSVFDPLPQKSRKE